LKLFKDRQKDLTILLKEIKRKIQVFYRNEYIIGKMFHPAFRRLKKGINGTMVFEEGIGNEFT